jgi:predicted TIM-barrel fold metal-dependent hydrolase
MPVIDTDVHEELTDLEELLPYLEPQWHSYVTDYGFHKLAIRGGMPYALTGGNRLDWSDEDGRAGTTVAALRRHLFDQEGESLAVLNGFFYVSVLSGQFEFASALASAYNDWQVEHWLDPEPRLRGSVHVVANDPAAAAREIDRVAAHPQIVQVFLPTVADRQYGDPFYDPIYEAALRNDLAVTFHHGPATRTLVGFPRYFAEWHTLAPPLAAMSQLTSLVFNGTLEKYEALRFVLLECSIGWLPWAMGRLDENCREYRVEVPWVKRLPSESIRANVRVSTQPLAGMTRQEFMSVVEGVESEEIFMFSSDYPHYDADDASTALPKGLPDGLRERVLYRNALDAYPRITEPVG